MATLLSQPTPRDRRPTPGDTLVEIVLIGSKYLADLPLGLQAPAPSALAAVIGSRPATHRETEGSADASMIARLTHGKGTAQPISPHFIGLVPPTEHRETSTETPLTCESHSAIRPLQLLAPKLAPAGLVCLVTIPLSGTDVFGSPSVYRAPVLAFQPQRRDLHPSSQLDRLLGAQTPSRV